MSEGYPFPIPKAIENDLFRGIVKAGSPWKDLDEYEESEGDPAMFGYFSCWRDRTIGLLRNMLLVMEEIVPMTYKDEQTETQWISFNGTLHGLEARLVQFEGLLEWARLTWSHDPAIQQALGKGLEVSPPREDIAPAPPAVADTQADNTPEKTDDQDRLPYSLPPEVWERVKPIVDRLQPINRQWLPLRTVDYEKPHFFGLMEDLDMDIERIILALEAGIDQVQNEIGDHWRETENGMSALRVVKMALEHLSKNHKDRLDWGYLTWKYDPAIRKTGSDTPVAQ